MAFYGKCVERIAAQSGEIARRMTERTLALHKIAMDELQRWEDAQALVIEEMLEHEKCRRSGIQITANQQVILGMRERARDTAYSQAQAAVKAAQTSDDTLAAMLGKLQIRVEGEVQHIHVSTHALKYLSETRRDMLAAGGGN